MADHVVDIADEGTVGALVAFARHVRATRRVVNNAATTDLAEDGDVLSQQVDVWDSIFAVNARGTLLVCKHALGR